MTKTRQKMMITILFLFISPVVSFGGFDSSKFLLVPVESKKPYISTDIIKKFNNEITTTSTDMSVVVDEIKSSEKTSTTRLPDKILIKGTNLMDKYVPPIKNSEDHDDDGWFIGVVGSFLSVLILALLSCLWRRYRRDRGVYKVRSVQLIEINEIPPPHPLHETEETSIEEVDRSKYNSFRGRTAEVNFVLDAIRLKREEESANNSARCSDYCDVYDR